jgi:DNA-binding IclR family transcriptional regulator
VVAAVSISGPIDRFTEERCPELVGYLWRTARIIERAL